MVVIAYTEQGTQGSRDSETRISHVFVLFDNTPFQPDIYMEV